MNSQRHLKCSARSILSCLVITTALAVSAQATCFPDLPSPVLTLERIHTEILDGFESTFYELDVTNYAEFPDELFDQAPTLPACGLNTSSSRTWVDIFVDGQLYYGFCGLGQASDLNLIFFAVPAAGPVPQSAYIVLDDRACDSSYTSNVLVFAPPTPTEAVSNLISQLSDPTLGLTTGAISTLTGKLQAAIKSIDKGNTSAAIKQLRSFINQVKSLERDGLLSAANAALLIATADSIIASL